MGLHWSWCAIGWEEGLQCDCGGAKAETRWWRKILRLSHILARHLGTNLPLWLGLECHFNERAARLGRDHCHSFRLLGMRLWRHAHSRPDRKHGDGRFCGVKLASVIGKK